MCHIRCDIIRKVLNLKIDSFNCASHFSTPDPMEINHKTLSTKYIRKPVTHRGKIYSFLM